MRDHRFWRALGPNLFLGLAEREGLGLREHVGGQDVVVVAERIERLGEADQVHRDELRPLVDQLVEAVLAVRPGLTPVHGAGLVVHRVTLERHVLAVGLHGQLLEVCREPLEVLVVGHHPGGLGVEEVPVPDGEQSHDHRQVLRQRCGPEVLVHLVEARQQLGEVVRPDRDHGGEADRRVHRVPAADPVPEPEHVLRVDAERRHAFCVGRDGHEMLGDRRSVTELPHHPVACRVRVRERLEGAERLGRDDEQGLVGRQIPGRLHKVGRVDVGDEPERHVAQAVVAKGLVRHHRAEVGPTDADVDDVLDPPPGVTGPLPRSHTVGERPHPPEDAVNLGHDVHPVDDEGLPLGHPKRHVEHRAVLRHVDLLASEHHVPAFRHTRLFSEVEQQPHGLVGDAVLGVVEVEVGGLDRQALPAAGVPCEQVAQVRTGDLFVMADERPICRTVMERVDGHVWSSR